MQRHESLQTQLQKVLAECARLKEENARLRELLGLSSEGVSPPVPPVNPAFPAPDSTTGLLPMEAKIALFRDLFRGREDVYAVRWEREERRVRLFPCLQE